MARRSASPPDGGHVVGLDLSLRAAAACAIPIGWDYDLAKVRMLRTGSKLTNDATPAQRAARNAQIAHDVLVFCLNVRARYVAVEDHAFGASTAHAMRLGECVGVVKHEVFQALGFAVEPVVAGAARKVMFQKLPRSDVKKFAIRNVKRLGELAEGWTDDECDAFVVCNWALERAGGTALSFPGV